MPSPQVLARAVGAPLLAATLVATTAGCAYAEEDAAGGPTRILIVGDSITQGKVGDWTWRYRLWQNLTSAGAAVDFVGPHQGLRDAETDSLDDLRYADPNFDTDHAARWGMGFATQEIPTRELVATYDPDVVVSMLGVNDLLWYGGTPEQVASSSEQFVADVRSVSPDASVVLGQLPLLWRAEVPAYNEQVVQLAARLDSPAARVVVARAPESFVEGVDTYDPLHPSEVGEVKIASGVAEALTQVGVGAQPESVPVVVDAPVEAPALRARLWPRRGEVRLSWTVPVGASGVYVWRRNVSAGGPWVRLEGGRRLFRVRPGRVVKWRVQAVKGDAVSPLFSDVVRVKRPRR